MSYSLCDYHLAKGWLTLEERDTLNHCAAEAELQHPNTAIVNIGVEYGASLHCLRTGAPTLKLYGVDLDNSKLQGDPGATLLTGDSNSKALAEAVTEPVSVLFIDGGHSRGVVREDIRLWTPKVIPGGVLIFHDYSDWELHEGVKAAVTNWSRRVQGWAFIDQICTMRLYRKA